MSDDVRQKPKLLELNRETIRDLTDAEAEDVRGGAGGGAWRPAAAAPSLITPTLADTVTRA